MNRLMVARIVAILLALVILTVLFARWLDGDPNHASADRVVRDAGPTSTSGAP